MSSSSLPPNQPSMLRTQQGWRKMFAGMQLASICAVAFALTTASIAHAQCDPPPTGTMVAWYPFDETGTGFSGPSGNLATQNAAVWDSATLPTPVPGEVAGGLAFNGNSYIDAPDSIVTNFGPAGGATCGGGDFSTCQGDFSMDVWINIPAPINGVVTILDKRDGNPIGYEFYLYRNTTYSNNTYIGVQLGDSTGYTNYESKPQNITPNVWHLLAITVDRLGKIDWYLDGAAVGTPVHPTQVLSLLNNVPLRIGATGTANGPSSYFTGSMDELELFNRVLTAKEVALLYKYGPYGKCKP
ncbi:MAG: LamG domain-containing protein [Terriglobales bacterium]